MAPRIILVCFGLYGDFMVTRLHSTAYRGMCDIETCPVTSISLRWIDRFGNVHSSWLSMWQAA